MKTYLEKFKYFMSLPSFYFPVGYLVAWIIFVLVVPIIVVTVGCYLYAGWHIAKSIYHLHRNIWEGDGHKGYNDSYEQNKDIV